MKMSNGPPANEAWFVETWDADTSMFSPQDGVPHCGRPLGELKAALRLLREMGYTFGDYSVHVERRALGGEIEDEI